MSTVIRRSLATLAVLGVCLSAACQSPQTDETPPASAAPTTTAPTTPAPESDKDATTPEPTTPVATEAATTPEPTPEPTPTPDAAQCEATDVTMAAIIERVGDVDAEFPAGGGPYDWAAARGIAAEVYAMAEQWHEETTDPLLLEDWPGLQRALDDLTEFLESEDEALVAYAGAELKSLAVAPAAAAIVSACPIWDA